MLVQYAYWMWDALRGDFGQSYSQRRPVSAILAERFPRSMELAALTLLLAVIWAVPLGVVSAVRQRSVSVCGGSMITTGMSHGFNSKRSASAVASNANFDAQ